ncbi:formate dehydrogenase [Azospirillum sp.]|uniref:formate dehydrogenase n=1 Tax=Azospirillum sp. TaxID=34012 RepID=UPI002D589BF2|nr:formate dehydrogenase [Azospirillum sp.]HYD70400.1 formate dehydrogenase [Azospirillum sp.]
MTDSNDKTTLKRRDLFRGLGAGALGAAAVAVTAAPAEAAARPDPNDPTAARYRETEHVRKAYALAAF